MQKVNSKKNKKIGFKEAFNELPAGKVKEVKESICLEMGWANSTFYSKIKGARKLKPPERVILQSIFEGYGIEL